MTKHQTDTYLALVRWQRYNTPRQPYRLFELVRVLRSDAVTVALALRLNGWNRDRVRVTRDNQRILKTYWVPPGAKPVSRRRRGRPSFNDLFNPKETS